MTGHAPGRLRGLTLRRRLAVSLSAAGLVLLLIVAAAAVLLVRLSTLQAQVVEDYFGAVRTGNQLFVTVVDAENAVRGYALTADRAQLGPLAVPGGAGQQGQLEQVRGALSEDPDLLAALDLAASSAEAWFESFALPLVDDVGREGTAAADPARTAEGDRLFAQVRTDFTAFQDQLLERRTEALEQLQDRTAGLFAIVLAAAAVAVAVAALLYVFLRRWVTTPLDRLVADVREVGSGQLQHVVAATGPPELAAVARDVDDMREALVRRLAEVEQAGRDVEAARLRLEEQAEELARSNRDLEQFAYVASHDLQEPLRKVASFCQLLQRRYGGELDERADQYIEFAVDGAKRMQQLINDLLAFSRVGRSADEHSVVPLEPVLRRALTALSTALEESGAKVTHDPLPEVRGDAGLLMLLMQNLVGNAVKFRGEAPPRVHVACRREGASYALAVVDNGIGIEPQYAERVFLIFQRLHPKTAYEGTGIGLALCKRIVEHHGGRIRVEPAEGGGTAVRLTLPFPVPLPGPVVKELV